ncbi:MAG: hypothetical protein ABIP17_02030 [Ilumatobacteraceae bacterium]
MFTTGSKLLIGSAFAAAVFATAYGITQGGALGTIGLISAALALSMLAALNIMVRDSNVSAMDHAAFESSPAAQASARPSLWPLLVAIGATTLTLGLVTSRAFFILGLVAIIAGGLEWLVQGWSERASSELAYNASARNLLADPLELPVAGAAGAAVVVYAFSRVMLGLPNKSSTVVAFAVLAAIVVASGAFVGTKRGLSRAAMTGAFSVAIVALIAAGAVFGLLGERATEEHHTTAYIAEENECGVAPTEADEGASQTIGGKSNLAAEVIFDGSTLTSKATGFTGTFDTLTLPRSNSNNIAFRNDSGDVARLVIEMHPLENSDGELSGAERLCTALVDEGGVQLLTIVFDRPSRAIEGGYEFTVPGSDVRLEVVVP